MISNQFSSWNLTVNINHTSGYFHAQDGKQTQKNSMIFFVDIFSHFDLFGFVVLSVFCLCILTFILVDFFILHFLLFFLFICLFASEKEKMNINLGD